MEGVFIGSNEQHSYCGTNVLNSPNIHRQLSAICGDKAAAHSTVFSWVWTFYSGKETTAQVAVHKCYSIILTEWFHSAIWKLQKRW
jgi:hypothetical protein